MAIDKRVTSLATAKLASSGLSPTAAAKLGIKTIASAKLIDKSWPDVPCLKFTYFDASGKERDNVCRVRVLETPRGEFGETDTDTRYLQSSGTPPAAYLPRRINWAETFEDPTKPIIITEGELKAACACELGFACIGLGGVWSWRTGKLGWSLLPELAACAWCRREVVIMFDSDAATKPQVALAIASLSTELSRRGALPRVAQLPSGPGGEKVGLDDFIVAAGNDEHAKAAVDLIIETADGDELARRLWEFNARFAFVLTPGLVFDETLSASHKPESFKGTLFANEWAGQRVVSADGSAKVKRSQVAPAWVEWPLRRQFERLTYAPGCERVVGAELNTWAGWGVEPKRGSVALWAELLDALFRGAPSDAREWFESWCLYPIANPGVKLPTAAGIWSTSQGIGKSLVGKTLGRIYGLNYSEVSQRELESQFNGWLVNKQFVMFDDVSAYDSRAKADVLKKIVTQERILVNIKGLPTYDQPDRANFYLTSNRPNAFYLEERDRRFFVHEATGVMMPPAFFHKYIDQWLMNGGPSALLYYAQHYDFKDFKPHAPPPLTRAKREMIDAVKSELELWLSELQRDPDAHLRVGKRPFERDMFTPSELLGLFDSVRKGSQVAVSVVGLRLRETFPRPADGHPLRPSGISERFYIIRNEEKWVKAPRAEVEKHIATARAKEQGASGKVSHY
jgi:hypothetical protein